MERLESKKVTPQPLRKWIGSMALLSLVVASLLFLTRPESATGAAPGSEPAGLRPQNGLCIPAGTDVSGPITSSGAWTLASSPYHVTGDVTISNSALLTIEPGVVVCFDSGTRLTVGAVASPGQLFADGTDSDPITFTANDASPTRYFWEGIEFTEDAGLSSLGHCVVEYAGTGLSSVDSDGHQVSNCTFRYNGDGADSFISGGALNIQGDGLSIGSNEIYDNELGIRLANSSTNEIVSNDIRNNDGYGVAFVAQGEPGGSDNLIEFNLIHENGFDGLQLNQGDGNRILSNEVFGNARHGIWVKGQSDLQIVGNFVRGNENGLVYADVNSAPDEIHSNVLCGNTTHNLQNLWSSTLVAEGNWFGTNTPDADGQIDDLAAVDYTPWIAMDVTLVPDPLPADGSSTSVFTLTMEDGAGHNVPDGHDVTIVPSEGSLADTALSLTSGVATTTYTAGFVPGQVGFEITDQCGTLPLSDELTLEEVLDLSVSKDDGSGIVPLYLPDKTYLVTYTVAYTNEASLAASGVVLTDDLPDGTEVHASNGWSCSAAQCTYEVGSLPVGGSGNAPPLVLEVLPDSITGCPDLRNTVTISDDGSQGPDINPGDNTFDLDTELPCLPDLVLGKSDNLDECLDVGEEITYELTYSNVGFADATGVVLIEQKPAHTSYVPSGWTCPNGTCTRDVGPVPKGDGGSVEFLVEIVETSPGGLLENRATINSLEDDVDPRDNEAEDTTQICFNPDQFVFVPMVFKNYKMPEPPPPERAYVKDVAVNSETSMVYVANPQHNHVLAVDPSGSGHVDARIPVGDYPLGVDVDTVTNKIYAANFYDGTATAIRGSDHTVFDTWFVGSQASKVAADPSDGRVYVSNHGETNDGAAAINSQTDVFEYFYTRLHSAQGRYGIDVDPDAGQLYIAARDAGLITLQDAYHPDQDPQLVKLDPARVPYVLVFNPATEHLFVTAPEDNKVVVLAPSSIQWSRGRWLTQGGQRVFTLDRFNAGWIKELDVGQGAKEGIAVNPGTGYVYVTNTDDDTVSILRDAADPAQIEFVEDIAVGDEPNGVDVDTTTNAVYVGNSGSKDLTVIGYDGTTDTHSVEKIIPLEP